MINDVFMLSAQSVAVSVSVQGSLFCLSQIMQFLIDKKKAFYLPYVQMSVEVYHHGQQLC